MQKTSFKNQLSGVIEHGRNLRKNKKQTGGLFES